MSRIDLEESKRYLFREKGLGGSYFEATVIELSPSKTKFCLKRDSGVTFWDSVCNLEVVELLVNLRWNR